MENNEIREICKEYGIGDYFINDDGSIDVGSSVDLSNFQLTHIPLKFNIVEGSFWINSNKLETLENSPNYVRYDFNCSNNPNLDSLKGCPEYVGSSFNCSYNFLDSLEYVPEVVDTLDVTHNDIKSFKSNIKKIKRKLIAKHNQIMDLYDLDPNIINPGCIIDISFNPIHSLFLDGININYIEWFNSIKPVRNDEVSLRRLKYMLSSIKGESVVIDDTHINLIKRHYKISNF